MLENLLSLGLIPLVIIVGFSPTWFATLYWLVIKFNKCSSESVRLSPVSVIASASYVSVVVTLCMLLLYAVAHSGI